MSFYVSYYYMFEKVNKAFNKSKLLKRDDFDTPDEAFELLISNMRTIPSKIWMPFYNDGSAKMKMRKILSLHKSKAEIIHVKKDFFTYKPKAYDVIIDNPPFSMKEPVLKRAKELGAFALLLPFDTIDRTYFKELFHDTKFQVIIPKSRYEFVGHGLEGVKNRIPFKCVWIVYNIPLRSSRQIIFERA